MIPGALREGGTAPEGTVPEASPARLGRTGVEGGDRAGEKGLGGLGGRRAPLWRTKMPIMTGTSRSDPKLGMNGWDGHRLSRAWSIASFRGLQRVCWDECWDGAE